MSVTARALIPSQAAPIAQTTLYTAPASTRTIIDKFTATNTAGAVGTVSVNLVPSAGASGASNLIVSAQAVAAGSCYTLPELVGHILNPGDFISVIASATTITLRASGREVV